MYPSEFQDHLSGTISEIKEAGLFKRERYISSSQNSTVTLQDGSEVINMCANNYLGLADHPRVVEAASAAAKKWGFGMASV